MVGSKEPFLYKSSVLIGDDPLPTDTSTIEATLYRAATNCLESYNYGLRGSHYLSIIA